MPQSTPYYGIIKESGLLPIKELIVENKIILFYDLLTSNKERTARKVLKVQMEREYEKCWYSELKELANEYQIDLLNIKTKLNRC